MKEVEAKDYKFGSAWAIHLESTPKHSNWPNYIVLQGGSGDSADKNSGHKNMTTSDLHMCARICTHAPPHTLTHTHIYSQ